MLRHSGGASKMAWLGGEQASGGPYGPRSLENWATEDLKTVGGPSPRKASWHELVSKFDLNVVYTPGPVNPVGDFWSRWPYPADPALGAVSINGTAQAAEDVRDMMVAEKEELLARPLVFRAVVAPANTRSKAAPRAHGAPACDPPPLASAPVVGGGRSKRESFGDWSELPR